MITVKVSSGIPNDLFLEIRFYMASIARKISSEVKGFLFIQLKKEEEYLYCGETIFIYGFNDFFPEEATKNLLLGKLRENINSPVVLIDSVCTRLGSKECSDFYFQVMSRSARHKSLLSDLRELGISNIQNSLVGSHIVPKDIGEFFVEVVAPPSELEFMMDVVWALKINKLLKISIWPKIALG